MSEATGVEASAAVSPSAAGAGNESLLYCMDLDRVFDDWSMAAIISLLNYLHFRLVSRHLRLFCVYLYCRIVPRLYPQFSSPFNIFSTNRIKTDGSLGSLVPSLSNPRIFITCRSFHTASDKNRGLERLGTRLPSLSNPRIFIACRIFHTASDKNPGVGKAGYEAKSGNDKIVLQIK